MTHKMPELITISDTQLVSKFKKYLIRRLVNLVAIGVKYQQIKFDFQFISTNLSGHKGDIWDHIACLMVLPWVRHENFP